MAVISIARSRMPEAIMGESQRREEGHIIQDYNILRICYTVCMARKHKKKQSHTKVVNERYTFSKKQGGGSINIEAWEDTNGTVVKYNIAYINHALYQQDNGRVIGYDNAHNRHHKHYFGKIEPIDDFTGYEEILGRFEIEIKEHIK